MTRLEQRIVELIAALGPIPVSEYMALCLFDPHDGYYTTREPFGVRGDFITAPEISQMFGELIAVWLYEAWRTLGEPMPVTAAEIGPGRGTLMKDMLRTLARLDQTFVSHADFAMVETSPRLADIQKKTLAQAPAIPHWHETIDTLPRAPLLIVGNELFDAIPIRQFVRMGGGWRERMVGLDDDDRLRFFAGAASLDPSLLPADAEDDEDADQQKLVRHRVHIGAKPRVLVEMAGDEAVDAVRDAGDGEPRESPVPARLQHRQHHRGHQQEAQDRDQVGNGHHTSYPLASR